MSDDFEAIDSLLAGVGPEAELPTPQVRRELREAAGLAKVQVARAIGVSPSTLAGWEAGKSPTGETRARYAYLLDGLRDKLTPPSDGDMAEGQAAAAEDGTSATAPAGQPDTNGGSVPQEDAPTDDDVVTLTAEEPCVLCGAPARHRVAGFVQHLDAATCRPASSGTGPRGATDASPTAPAPAPVGQQADKARELTRPARPAARPARRAFQAPATSADVVHARVRDALAAHHGDVEAATAALVKKAIPDAMALLDETRKGGRYDVIAHPWIPDVLKKQTSRGADQVWEARPKWTRSELPPGVREITALDINGAYLSALKTHLPLGQLEHSTGLPHDRRRAGVHLITPPDWHHDAVLPNPIGQRDEPGPLWVTEPTLRLLLRLSGPRHGLCDAPEVHESYTSGATEGLLEKFRVALKDARDRAISEDDPVTLEYVKAMYSKFVSTMGESNYNRELYRPDWMHIIRSQAFANLWMKALKAHERGLTVVRAMGTDELHVSGDWRAVFPEGRGVTEVKVKDVYGVGTGPTDGEGR